MSEPLRYNTPITNMDGTPTQFFQRLWQVLFRQPVLTLAASQEPVRNGELVFEATSNTSLTFKYRGSDGVVRSGSITLS